MKSLRKNATYNTAYQIVRLGFPIVTYPYVSRLIGPVGIGTVVYAEAIAQYFCVFAMLGVPVYGSREISISRSFPNQTESVFSSLFLITTITSWLALIIYAALPLIFPVLAPDPVLFWMFAAVIFFNSGRLEWFFSGIEEYRYITTRNLFLKVIGLAMTFILITHPEHYVRYGIIWLITNVFGALLNIRYALQKTRILWHGLRIIHHLKAIVPTAALLLSEMLYRSIDVVMLGILVSDDRTSVGFYNTAGRVVRLATTIVTAAAAVSVPRVALHFAKGDDEAAKNIIRKSFSVTLFFGLPMAAGLFILAPDIIQLFAGAQFSSAISTLKILSGEIILIGISGVIGAHVLYATGKEKTSLFVTIFGFTIAVILNFFLIPIHQQDGAAFATILTRVIVFFALMFLSKEITVPSLMTLDVLRILISTIGMALFLWLGIAALGSVPIIARILLLTIVSTLVYGVSAIALNVETGKKIFSILQLRIRRSH